MGSDAPNVHGVLPRQNCLLFAAGSNGRLRTLKCTRRLMLLEMDACSKDLAALVHCCEPSFAYQCQRSALKQILACAL